MKNGGGRFKSIIIPYVIWCTLYFLYYVLVTHIPAIRSIMSNSEVVELTFSNWIRHITVDEYYTLWFLKNLIVFILLTPCLYYLLKDYSKAVPSGFIVLVGVMVISYLVNEKVINIGFNIPLGLDIYMAGAYIGINHKGWICKTNRTVSVVSLAIVISFFLTAFRWFTTPFQIVFFIACWYALDLARIKKTYWWMEITFFTYVAHDIPLESFEKIYFMTFGHSPISSLIDYVFMPLIVESLLIAVAYIMIKFTSKVWKVICGGRVPELTSATKKTIKQCN